MLHDVKLSHVIRMCYIFLLPFKHLNLLQYSLSENTSKQLNILIASENRMFCLKIVSTYYYLFHSFFSLIAISKSG